MRQILFRAKRIDNGEWVEGFYCKRKHYCFDTRTDDLKAVIVTEFSSGGFVSYEVDENTICQYTGLTDKNGNKIWENDIVKHYNNPNEPTQYVIGAIYWNEDNVRYERSSQYEHAKFSVLYDCVYEVIGNIFDNADLLKGE